MNLKFLKLSTPANKYCITFQLPDKILTLQYYKFAPTNTKGQIDNISRNYKLLTLQPLKSQKQSSSLANCISKYLEIVVIFRFYY